MDWLWSRRNLQQQVSKRNRGGEGEGVGQGLDKPLDFLATSEERISARLHTSDLGNSTEGTLCVFNNSTWSPVCTEAFATQTMHTLCRYMGWPRGLYNQLVPKDQGLVVVPEVKSKENWSPQGELQGQCSHVSLACDPSACGRRPLYLGMDNVPNEAVAAWPWAANLFVEDEQVLQLDS